MQILKQAEMESDYYNVTKYKADSLSSMKDFIILIENFKKLSYQFDTVTVSYDTDDTYDNIPTNFESVEDFLEGRENGLLPFDANNISVSGKNADNQTVSVTIYPQTATFNLMVSKKKNM